MKRLPAIMLAVVLGSFAVAPANAGLAHFDGLVDHVSSNSIKVLNPRTHESLNFSISPNFKQVFSAGGRPESMASIHEGDNVKVYYDQRGLSHRWVDRIILGRQRKPDRPR